MVALPQTYYAAASPSIIVTCFETAMPKGKVPAIGPMERMSWDDLTELCMRRRTGPKDGANIVLARFKPEPDGRARRLKENVLARTGIALDFETSKLTGEVPPSIAEAADRVRAQGWSACIYSSHNHSPAAPRFRIVIPLSDEIDPALPAPEVVATSLGLDGVLDRSKLGAQSVFYLPSAEPGRMADHETLVMACAAERNRKPA